VQPRLVVGDAEEDIGSVGRGLACRLSVGVYTTWDTEVPGLGNKYEILPGFAIGTGIEMIVEKDINAFAQVKYIISKYQQLIIYVGIHYYFVGRKYRTW